MIRKIYLFFILLAFFFSCKEDTDKVFPTIVISSPNENSNYKVLEALPLKIRLNDNKSIEHVRVSLSELNSGKVVLNNLNFYPGSSNFTIDQAYSLSDSLLNTGQYSIRVDAYDGKNTSSAFVSIIIEGIEKKSLSVIMALDRGTSVDFTEMVKDQSQSNVHSSSVIRELAIDSRNQQLWYSMRNNKIAAYDWKQMRLNFEDYPNSNGQSDRIRDASLLGSSFYVSTDRGSVQAFSPNYQDIFTYTSPTGFRVMNIYPLKDRIVVREEDTQGNNQSLIYLFGNGAIDSRFAIQADIAGLGFKDSEPDRAHLFVNNSSGFEVNELNLENGNTTTIASRTASSIRSIIRVRDFEFVLIAQTQVYLYNLSTGFLRSLASNLINPKVAFDEVDGIVYVSSGSQLRAYDYEQASLIFNSSQAFPILDLAVRYNK